MALTLFCAATLFSPPFVASFPCFLEYRHAANAAAEHVVCVNKTKETVVTTRKTRKSNEGSSKNHEPHSTSSASLVAFFLETVTPSLHKSDSAPEARLLLPPSVFFVERRTAKEGRGGGARFDVIVGQAGDAAQPRTQHPQKAHLPFAALPTLLQSEKKKKHRKKVTMISQRRRERAHHQRAVEKQLVFFSCLLV
jgi:hypothetical protein